MKIYRSNTFIAIPPGMTIKEVLEDRHMTQKELAKILNISQRTLSHYELGTRDVPTQVLIALADFYKCSTDYLLGRTNKKEMNL